MYLKVAPVKLLIVKFTYELETSITIKAKTLCKIKILTWQRFTQPGNTIKVTG